MEKRKLAKIPSEEASDEMVRFSDRATGTHIITTKAAQWFHIVQHRGQARYYKEHSKQKRTSSSTKNA